MIESAAWSHRLYKIWYGMHYRCRSPRAGSWKYHGERGIRVCDRWNDFANFLEDMEPSFEEGRQLDRFPDNNGNYCKENCRWATRKEQAGNRRPWGSERGVH